MVVAPLAVPQAEYRANHPQPKGRLKRPADEQGATQSFRRRDLVEHRHRSDGFWIRFRQPHLGKYEISTELLFYPIFPKLDACQDLINRSHQSANSTLKSEIRKSLT